MWLATVEQPRLRAIASFRRGYSASSSATRTTCTGTGAVRIVFSVTFPSRYRLTPASVCRHHEQIDIVVIDVLEDHLVWFAPNDGRFDTIESAVCGDLGDRFDSPFASRFERLDHRLCDPLRVVGASIDNVEDVERRVVLVGEIDRVITCGHRLVASIDREDDSIVHTSSSTVSYKSLAVKRVEKRTLPQSTRRHDENRIVQQKFYRERHSLNGWLYVTGLAIST